MSSLSPDPTSPADAAPLTTTSPRTDAPSFLLVGSYETVQVLSPTLVNDVVYCTIQTQPHNVTASLPVTKTVFDSGQAGPELAAFARSIERVMDDPRVIAGVGSQTIDDSGLLADNVVFTVQYIDPVLAPNGATALATVGVGLLNQQFTPHQGTASDPVTAIIDGVYANLKAAASG